MGEITKRLGEERGLLIGIPALILLIAWQSWSLQRYTRLDQRPPTGDQAAHLEIVHELARAKTGGPLAFVAKPPLPQIPPMYHLALLHLGPKANLLYMIVLVWCLMAIGLEYKKDESAVIAVVLWLGTPICQRLFYSPSVELALTALACASYWALLRSGIFAAWIFSLVFGAAFGLGMLHHWAFASFMIPALVFWGRALAREDNRWRAAAALAAALFIMAPWYRPNLGAALHAGVMASRELSQAATNAISFFSLLWQGLAELGPPFWALVVVGIAIPMHHWDRRRAWMMQSWALGSYVFWALLTPRPIKTLAPGLAGLSVITASHWPKTLILAVAAFQLLCADNYGKGWIGPFAVDTPMFRAIFLPSDPPEKQDWAIPAILETLRKEPPATVCVAAMADRLNWRTLSYMAKKAGMDGWTFQPLDSATCRNASIGILKNPDPDLRIAARRMPEDVRDRLRKGLWPDPSWKEFKEGPLPDASRVSLWRRRGA